MQVLHPKGISKAETQLGFCKRVLLLLRLANSLYGRQWERPLINKNYDGEIVFEWWYGSRKLTLFVSEDEVQYLKFENDFEEGRLVSWLDVLCVWSWLVGTNDDLLPDDYQCPPLLP